MSTSVSSFSLSSSMPRSAADILFARGNVDTGYTLQIFGMPIRCEAGADLLGAHLIYNFSCNYCDTLILSVNSKGDMERKARLVLSAIRQHRGKCAEARGRQANDRAADRVASKVKTLKKRVRHIRGE